jgi:putative FmdB family regulatory protein
MAFKLDDYKCLNCENISEFLVEVSEDESSEICPYCGSRQLEKQISVSSNRTGHSSWAKWRGGLG